MAGTLKNFLTNAMDRASQTASDTADWMKSKYQGLRGGATPGVEPAAGAGPIESPGVTNAAPQYDAASQAAEQAHRAKMDAFNQRAGMRGSAQPMSEVGASPSNAPGGSPEAQAFRASGAGNPLTPPKTALDTASKWGGKALRAAGRVAPWLAVGQGMSEGAKGLGTDTETYRAEQGLPEQTAVGRGLRSMGVPENASRLGDDLAVRYAGMSRRIVGMGDASPLASAGGATPNASSGNPTMRSAAPSPAGTTTGAQGQTPSAEALMKGTAIPASGTGAFRGGDRPAVSVGGENAPNETTPVNAQAYRRAHGLATEDVKPPNGVFGYMAGAGAKATAAATENRTNANKLALRSGDIQLRGQDVQLAGHDMQNRLALYDRMHTLGNENEQRVEKRTTEYARGKVAQPSGGLLSSGDRQNYEGQVKAKADETHELVKYSIADRKDGKTIGDLSPTEHNQLLLANDLREKITDARGGIVQTMRDFFGNKQFNTKNLYSYMPTGAERSLQGGYLIHFANGNTAHVKETAGGQFQIFGPNTPIDADIMAVLKPYINKAKAGG